jgi:hypothetical protein
MTLCTRPCCRHHCKHECKTYVITSGFGPDHFVTTTTTPTCYYFYLLQEVAQLIGTAINIVNSGYTVDNASCHSRGNVLSIVHSGYTADNTSSDISQDWHSLVSWLSPLPWHWRCPHFVTTTTTPTCYYFYCQLLLLLLTTLLYYLLLLLSMQC